MREDIEDYIRHCKTCQVSKAVNWRTKEPMVITDTPHEVFSKVAVDTVGPFQTTTSGNKHVLTMQCLLSKFCIAVPVPNISAVTVADAIARNLISLFGVPKIIISDRGTSFKNKLLSEFANIFGFKLATTTAYHPQSNGSLERSHSLLNSFLRTRAGTQLDWDKLVPFAIHEYNTSVHRATNFTPFEVVFGRTCRTPERLPNEYELETYHSYLKNLIDRLREIKDIARNNLINAKRKYKKDYDKTAKPQNLTVGMKVYVKKEARKGKLDAFFNGTFTVKEIHYNNDVLIESPNGKIALVHMDRVKRAYE